MPDGGEAPRFCFMRALERLRRSDAWLMAAVFAAVVRAVLPQGLAIGNEGGRLALLICTERGPKALEHDPGIGAGTVLASGVCHVAHSLGCGAGGAPLPRISAIHWTTRTMFAVLPLEPAPPAFRPQAPRAPPEGFRLAV